MTLLLFMSPAEIYVPSLLCKGEALCTSYSWGSEAEAEEAQLQQTVYPERDYAQMP